MRVTLAGSALMAVGFGLSHMARAEGNAALPMQAMLTGALTNIVLDYLAVFPLRLGVAGADGHPPAGAPRPGSPAASAARSPDTHDAGEAEATAHPGAAASPVVAHGRAGWHPRPPATR